MRTKLKDIKGMLKNDAEYLDNGQLLVRWCAVGDNFYDYGEDEPEEMDFSEKWEFLRDDPRIVWKKCDDCCRCAGW